jgi:hypothetical protein
MAEGIHLRKLKPKVNDYNYCVSIWVSAVVYLRFPSFSDVAPCHRVNGASSFDTI